MSKTYIIRSLSFSYNDDYLYTQAGCANILETYTDREKAMEALSIAEQKMFSGIMVENFEPISNCCNNNKAKEDLENYLQAEFGLSMMQKLEGWDKPLVNRQFCLPTGLTVEQTLKIREASQIHFHELLEISKNSSVWGIRCGKNMTNAGEWIKIKASRRENGKLEFAEIPIYFKSRADAEIPFGYTVSSFLSNVEIRGSLEELSDTPTLLSAFIEKTDRIDYDVEKHLIKTKYLDREYAITFHELLKEKRATIEPFSLEEAQAIEKGWEIEV